jgi:hypothetical protein
MNGTRFTSAEGGDPHVRHRRAGCRGGGGGDQPRDSGGDKDCAGEPCRPRARACGRDRPDHASP